MAHFLLDIPGGYGLGPRLMVPRNRASFQMDTSAFSHLTQPAVEPQGPSIPGEISIRTPQDVCKGLGLGYDAERGLEQVVREWLQVENPVAFRSQLYHGLVALAPRDYSMRNEIARRVQALWKSNTGGRWSRRPGQEGRLVLQKAEQLGFGSLLNVSVSKPGTPEPARLTVPSIPKPPAAPASIPEPVRLTVPKSAIPEVAERIIGHADWKKSLVIPDMPLDRLLERTRVQMQLKERSGVGDLVWMCEEVPDEMSEHRRSYAPQHWPVDALGKGMGHRYIKRVLVNKPGHKYRYYYKLPSGEVVSDDDLKTGARFKVEHQGKVGHFEIQSHDQERGLVHVKHDESGKEAHIRTQDLKKLVQGYHAKQTAKTAGPPEIEAPRLPTAEMKHLGAGGYDEIHGFGKTPEELHRHASKLDMPDREFATIPQPGGHVLASRPKGGTAATKEAEAKEAAAQPPQVAPHLSAHAEEQESKITVVRRDPITGEETVIGGKKPKPKAPKAEPEPEKPRESESATPAVEEKKTKIFMRGDSESGKALKAVPAEYVLMEATDLIPSHDPDTYQPRPEYPVGVQERNYDTVDSDREKVERFAAQLEPAMLISTNPDAINGPPIINQDNIVLGGNGRAMGMARAYKHYPENAQAMKDYLSRHARAFGHTAADVAGMKEPILVRKMKTGDPSELSALGRRMNEPLTQGMNPRDAEVTLGKHYVNQDVMDSLSHHMDPDERLSSFLNSGTSKPFVAQIKASGLIDQYNEGEFVDQETGLLNEDGRHRVERVLAARIIPDAKLLSRMDQKARESIAMAVPFLAACEARGWDFRKPLELAVRADIEQRGEDAKAAEKAKGGPKMTSKEKRDRYEAQLEQPVGGSGIRGKLAGDEVARVFHEVMQEHMGTVKFPKAMKRVALESDRQHHDYGTSGARDFFAREKVSPAEALRHAFGLAGPKKSTAPVEEKAATPKSQKPRRKKGENDLDYYRRVLAEAGGAGLHHESGQVTPVAPEAAPMETQTPAETPEMAPGRGWETARRAKGPAATSGGEDTEEARAARDAEWMRQVRGARGEEREQQMEAPPDTRTASMFASLPAPPWAKAFTEDGAGAGRYVMHAVTWEAKRLVRAAVGAAHDGTVDSRRVVKRLKAFVQDQASEDKDFAHALGAHPVTDATLRGLVQALVGAHAGQLAKSMARWSLLEDSAACRVSP